MGGMRIVAGKHKGRALQAAEDQSIRPSSARTREAVFNILMHNKFLGGEIELAGADVADLCCGTGAFALEALSRGAARVILVDHQTASLRIAQKNVLHLNETTNCRLLQADVVALPPAPYPCDILYLDPPYGQKLAEPALQIMMAKGWLKPRAMVLVEQQAKELLTLPEGLRLLDARVYGNAKVSILTNAMED